MLLNPGRCHARWFFHALHKGKNGPQLNLWLAATGRNTKDHPRLFRGSILGNMPTRVEAFPGAIRWRRDTRLKALWIGYRNLRTSKIALQIKHRSAFTRGTDVPRNCLTLFCFQCTVSLFSQRSKKVERLPARAGSTIAFPHGLKHPGLRPAKSPSPCQRHNSTGQPHLSLREAGDGR
jgi:hypothetical protein